MQKKGLIVIGVLLAVILCMQVRLLLRVKSSGDFLRAGILSSQIQVSW